jgi:hypothetical protein
VAGSTTSKCRRAVVVAIGRTVTAVKEICKLVDK